MKPLLEIAEKAEGVLHKAFLMKGDEFGFDLPKAMLVGITLDENGDFADIQPELASHGDIYTLLESVSPETLAGFQVFGVVTCGWAAPIAGSDDEETAPSQHPQRRRVRLFVCAKLKEQASVLRFQDEADEAVTDAGDASGPLSEAIAELAVKANATQN